LMVVATEKGEAVDVSPIKRPFLVHKEQQPTPAPASHPRFKRAIEKP